MRLFAAETLQRLPAAIVPRLIAMFADTTPTLLAEIRQNARSGNLQAMGKAAHKLKGSCVSLGAERMAEICMELQHKGETQNGAGVEQLVADLAALYPQTLDALQSTMPTGENC